MSERDDVMREKALAMTLSGVHSGSGLDDDMTSAVLKRAERFLAFLRGEAATSGASA